MEMKWLLGIILQVENLILEVLLGNLLVCKSERVTVSQCYSDFIKLSNDKEALIYSVTFFGLLYGVGN